MRITFHLGEDEVSRFEIASHVGGATPGVPRPEGGAAQPRSGDASADTSWDWRACGRGRMPRGVPTSLRGTAGKAVKAQTPGRGRGEEGRGEGRPRRGRGSRLRASSERGLGPEQRPGLWPPPPEAASPPATRPPAAPPQRCQGFSHGPQPTREGRGGRGEGGS